MAGPKGKKKAPNYKRKSSVLRRVERMQAQNPFIPAEVIEGFARTPESIPKEKKRRGRGYRPATRALTPDEERQMFEAQGGRCRYCCLPFGTVVYRRGVRQVLRMTLDHWLPYSRFRNNSRDVVVLACDLCNMFKSERVFSTVYEARCHIRERFIRKGYSLAPPGQLDFTNGASLRVNGQYVYVVSEGKDEITTERVLEDAFVGHPDGGVATR